MLLRKVLRPAARAQQQISRRTLTDNNIIHKDDVTGTSRWKYFSYFLAAPAVILAYVNAFIVEPEDHSPPPFVPYEHIRLRKKAFFWGNGDRTVFHNPQTNATSEGYEEEYVAHH